MSGKRVYISSPDRDRALELKCLMEEHGHVVVSSWHDAECKRTKDRDSIDLRDGADRNITQITDETEVLVLDCPDGECAGGLYVEAGAALAAYCPVFALNGLRLDGTRRNNLLYHPQVHLADSAVAAASAIGEVELCDEWDDDDIADMDDDEDDFDDLDDDEDLD